MGRPPRKVFVPGATSSPQPQPLSQRPGTYMEIDESEDDLPDEVEQHLTELRGSGNYTVQIYHYNEDKAYWELCKRVPIDQFNESAVPLKYGGGQYKFTVRNPDGTFKENIRANYADEGGTKNSVPAATDNAQKEMVSMLKDEISQSRAKEQNLYSAMFGMMTTLIQSMNAPKSGGSREDFIDTYVKLKAIDGKNPAAEVSSVIDLIKTGMNIGKDIGSASADSSPEDMLMKKLIDMGGNFLPALIAAASKKPAQQAQPAQQIEQPEQAPQQTQPQLQVIPGLPQIQTQKEGTDMIKLSYRDDLEKTVIETLNESKNNLLFAANAGVDTPLVVNTIMSKLDEKALDMLYDYYQNEDAFARTLEFIPAFKAHNNWFMQIMNELLDAIDAMTEPAAPAAVIPNDKGELKP